MKTFPNYHFIVTQIEQLQYLSDCECECKEDEDTYCSSCIAAKALNNICDIVKETMDEIL